MRQKRKYEFRRYSRSGRTEIQSTGLYTSLAGAERSKKGARLKQSSINSVWCSGWKIELVEE